jgi:hypothetical protein
MRKVQGSEFSIQRFQKICLLLRHLQNLWMN